jgi:hypothetical protein
MTDIRYRDGPKQHPNGVAQVMPTKDNKKPTAIPMKAPTDISHKLPAESIRKTDESEDEIQVRTLVKSRLYYRS